MNKEVLCLCSHCRKIFKLSEAIHDVYERGISKIPVDKCPHCKSRGYTALKDLRFFERMLTNEK